MHNSITLDNGEEFTKYYGGHLVSEGKRLQLPLHVRSKYAAPFSAIREYLRVEYKTLEGIKFVSVGSGEDAIFLTLCGNYKIARYYKHTGCPNFNVYRCVVWRESLKSTFGDYADCKQHNKTLLQAVNELKTILELKHV